jgi:hypothetical protein
MSHRAPLSFVALLASLALNGATAQTALFDWRGVAAGANIGKDACALGDVDGDLIPDVAVLEAEAPSPTVSFLRARSGYTGAELWRYQPASSVIAVRRVGDVNGDGFDDVAVGVQQIYNLVAVLSGEDGTPLWSVTGGPGFFDYVPSLVGAGPDLDGDGVGDVLVRGDAAWISASRAEVRSGATGALLAEYPTGSYLASRPIALSPDTDGDGFADLVVGALQSTGQVLVLSGPGPVLTLKATITGPPNPVLTLLYFGSRVEALGDVDGDGLGDFALGTAPYASFGFPPFPPPTPPPSFLRVYLGGSWTVAYELGGATEIGVGGTIDAIGDVDGDGLPDFAVSGAANASDLAGVSLRVGATGALLTSETAVANVDYPRFRPADDVNLDGRKEFLVLTPGFDGPANDVGRLRVSTLAPIAAASAVDLGGGCFATFTATPPVPGTTATLAITGATPFLVGNLVFDFAPPSATPLLNGCVFHANVANVASWWLLPIGVDGAGSLSFPFSIPSFPLAVGFQTTMQAFFFAPANPLGYELSNGIHATVGY